MGGMGKTSESTVAVKTTAQIERTIGPKTGSNSGTAGVLERVPN